MRESRRTQHHYMVQRVSPTVNFDTTEITGVLLLLLLLLLLLFCFLLVICLAPKVMKKRKKPEYNEKSTTTSPLLLFVGCLTSQQHASVSQGRICSDNLTRCHTETEVADQTFHLTHSILTPGRPVPALIL